MLPQNTRTTRARTGALVFAFVMAVGAFGLGLALDGALPTVLASGMTAVVVGAAFVLNRRVARGEADRARALLEQKERAEATTEAKSEFLAMTTHELRTPLTAVIGIADLMVDGDDAALVAEQRELLLTIKTSAEAMLTIVNDVLDYSKIEANQMQLDNRPFDLRRAVNEVGDVLAIRAEQHGLELITRIASDVPIGLVGDRGRLKQVLVNLANNAIKFTPEGEVLVNVECVGERAGEALLRFEIRDTGIGISESKLDQLFRSFSQVATSTVQRKAGTGLGLMISKRTVEAMGGQIGVESSKGSGSVFWFTARFPRDDAGAERLALPDALRDVRVLVADGNISARSAVRDLLNALGARAEEAEHGEEALALLRAADASDPYRIAVVAHSLTDGANIALAQVIATDPQLVATGVCLMGPISARSARRGDRVRFLAKPVKAAALVDALAATCGCAPDASTAVEGLPVATPLRGRVLVADDNEINRRVVAKMLEHAGVEVAFATSGREAVEAVARGGIDLVLMDRQMPEMSGLEATRAIRSRASGERRLPIIAFTASTRASDLDAFLDAGADDCLAKPVRPAELRAALERWLVPPSLPSRPTSAGDATRAADTLDDATRAL